jgi:putative heme-binding domain-containing protein
MRKPLLFTLLLAGVALIGFRALSEEQPPEFVLPEGFAVEEVYSPEQAGSVVGLTFDNQGRLVVAREFGPILTLFDNNGDGVYDEERQFSEEVGTSQGIFFDGPDLLVVGRGPQGVGLYRGVDENGDARGERVELIERAWGSIGDHGPHAVFFGPDGYLYWDQGNGSGIFEQYLPLSQLREWDEASMNGRIDPRGHASNWRAPGGIFLRTNYPSRGAGQTREMPENVEWELFAGGFRNQYDGAFNMIGELFTLDSDMEWDRDLPHYKGTSSVHVIPGGDHAWRSGSMNHPWYYIDNLPPMVDQGRGSPTGVAVLQTYNYPAEYWDMVLQADWSRGRVIGGRLTKNGATYTQSGGNFIYGEPLNVTDLEVGPDGNLYFALGGRSTMGGIYRLVYNGPNAMQRPAANTPLDRVLTMPQPRSAYSRQMALDTKTEMGEAAWQQGLTAEVRNTSATPERRVRAMELLQVFGPGMDDNVLRPLANDPSWEVRAATAYYLGMRANNSARQTLVALTKDSDPFVQRRALEGLIRTGVNPTMNPPFSPVEDIVPLLSHSDRFVRYQARAVLNQTRRALWEDAVLSLEGYPQAAEGLLAFVQTLDDPRITDITRAAARAARLIQANPSDQQLLQLIRVAQRAMLEDYGVTGHSTNSAYPAIQPPFNTPGQGGGGGGGGQGGQGGQQQTTSSYQIIGETLLARFPSADTSLSREMARTLAYLGTPGAIEKISMELNNERNNRNQQIFYAEQLSYMDEGWDEASVERMASWLEKVYTEQWRGGASFTGYINYIRDAFLEFVPPEQHAAIAQRMEAAQPQVATATPGAGGGGGGGGQQSEAEMLENLVYSPNILTSSPAGGAWAYEKALCITCHTFGPIGTEFGPDLTTINQRFTRLDLVRAVMHPSETVSDLWQQYTITRTNGETVSGTIYSENAQNVVVQIPGGGQVTIPTSQIRSREISEVSPMPEGLLYLLTGAERTALFTLLQAGPEAIPDSALARINNR